MPFTPTHVLAVLPFAALKRVRLPFAALAIGSMIPDFPLFVPWSPGYETTHSVPGLVTACLPLGLACFLLLEGVMKRPLVALLPAVVRSRCASLAAARQDLRLRSIAWASLAVVIGAATHVFWDAFTHRGRWGTRLFPSLGETALIVGGQAVPGYKVLQYGSTLIGLPCLALLLAAWLCRRRPEPVEEGPDLGGRARVVVGLALLTVGLLAGLVSWFSSGATRYQRLGSSITSSGLALMFAMLVYCLAYPTIGARGLRSREADVGEEPIAWRRPTGRSSGPAADRTGRA